MSSSRKPIGTDSLLEQPAWLTPALPSRFFAATNASAQTMQASGSEMPWDRDPRASYLLIDEGKPHLVRVAYDIEHEATVMRQSHYPDARRLAEMRRQGAFVQPTARP